MIYLLIAYAIAATILAIYYRDKAKEFESLFELSKGYGNDVTLIGESTWYAVGRDPKLVNGSIKLNKDGSIAKKRGKKAKV